MGNPDAMKREWVTEYEVYFTDSDSQSLQRYYNFNGYSVFETYIDGTNGVG